MSEGVRLYAGTQHGLFIWRSRNNGWEEIARHFPDGIIDSFSGCKRARERVFAGVTHNGVYRTDNGGKNWTKLLDGDIRSITVDPTDDKVIYAGMEPVALYRSEDGGGRWQELTALKELPETVRKNWWFPQPPHLGHVRQIFIHPDNSNIIYLCIEHGGVMRSLDRGNSWEDVSKGIDYLDIHVISNLPGSLQRYYVATARGFFTTDDPCAGWVRAENGLTRNYFHDFLFLPPAETGDDPNMVLATADGSPGFWRRENRGARAALFISKDAAKSWQRVTRGIKDDLDSMVWALVHHPHEPKTVFAGFGNMGRGHAHGAGGAGDLMISRDMGESWQRLNIDLPADRVLWAAAED
jgi:photosystem II stability/assembly factor-like uncharacterized protein